ncbi:hypothetical protein ADUPG1_009395 [Aduncisulcus paluster]|uniref:Uncharacterized protein n=1 Tax=Aduncisulcus paluster TaxID=2918883 RepID=A0ABQ5KWP4_9EUKA|nr:hypothetical protein ADUPG1_009395 [Aduncisulcus paluster]
MLRQSSSSKETGQDNSFHSNIDIFPPTDVREFTPSPVLYNPNAYNLDQSYLPILGSSDQSPSSFRLDSIPTSSYRYPSFSEPKHPVGEGKQAFDLLGFEEPYMRMQKSSDLAETKTFSPYHHRSYSFPPISVFQGPKHSKCSVSSLNPVDISGTIDFLRGTSELPFFDHEHSSHLQSYPHFQFGREMCPSYSGTGSIAPYSAPSSIIQQRHQQFSQAPSISLTIPDGTPRGTGGGSSVLDSPQSIPLPNVTYPSDFVPTPQSSKSTTSSIPPLVHEKGGKRRKIKDSSSDSIDTEGNGMKWKDRSGKKGYSAHDDDLFIPCPSHIGRTERKNERSRKKKDFPSLHSSLFITTQHLSDRERERHHLNGKITKSELELLGISYSYFFSITKSRDLSQLPIEGLKHPKKSCCAYTRNGGPGIRKGLLCANRECISVLNTSNKRSPYCCKKCQTREQNLRQKRVMHASGPLVRKKTFVLHDLFEQFPEMRDIIQLRKKTFVLHDLFEQFPEMRDIIQRISEEEQEGSSSGSSTSGIKAIISDEKPREESPQVGSFHQIDDRRSIVREVRCPQSGDPCMIPPYFSHDFPPSHPLGIPQFPSMDDMEPFSSFSIPQKPDSTQYVSEASPYMFPQPPKLCHTPFSAPDSLEQISGEWPSDASMALSLPQNQSGLFDIPSSHSPYHSSTSFPFC